MYKPFLILFVYLISCSKTFAADNYPVGARSIGLSNAFVSISDTWSTFHNQATLASLQNFSAGVFYESRFMIDELSLAGGSLVFPNTAGTLGVSFYQFGKGTFKEQKAGFSFSKQLSEKINAGIQLDYFSQHYPENEKSAGFATFECGLTYSATNQLTLGVHAFNPVKNGFELPEGKQKMPAIYRLGGHYQFSELVLICAEAQKTTGYKTVIKTGLEFSPVKNMALRFGVSGQPVKYSAGFGYSFGKITTDIAFSYHGNLGLSPSISVQFQLP
uniref:hypothetical protein n=1 Tax=uncultured Draconibacterium sp. TaxID=1573823 RepID=UPI0032171D67